MYHTFLWFNRKILTEAKRSREIVKNFAPEIDMAFWHCWQTICTKVFASSEPSYQWQLYAASITEELYKNFRVHTIELWPLYYFLPPQSICCQKCRREILAPGRRRGNRELWPHMWSHHQSGGLKRRFDDVKRQWWRGGNICIVHWRCEWVKYLWKVIMTSAVTTEL